MNWKHGYYADSGYTYGYYAETAPMRLAWAALIQGQQTPTANFRYLDAGCGQGLSLILMAAAHPESEFVGIDFLPEHVAHATELANACGLQNVRFIEGDFIELAKDPSALGQFDYAVCHGITTWIAPPVKKALFSLIGQVLRPGGLFYNSYNTFPGWLSAVPFQHLVLLEQRSKTGALALKSARESMDRLKVGGKAMFANLPGLPGRLKSMETQDPAYLVQEYNNQFWQPVFVTEMMDDMAAVKLSFLGTATLPEAFDSSYVPEVRELLSTQATPELREQLRDYAGNQSFRRDLYVKGRSRPWSAEQEDQVRAFRFALNPSAARPEAGQPFIIKAGTIELNGDAGFYGSILDLLAGHNEGLSVGDIIDRLTDARKFSSTVQALTMLLHAGWLVLRNPGVAKAAARDCNAALAKAVCAGAPYRYISLPGIGGAAPVGDTEWFILNAAIEGQPRKQWAESALAVLRRLNRSLVKDGKVISETSEQISCLQGLIDDLVKSRLEFFKAMGAF